MDQVVSICSILVTSAVALYMAGRALHELGWLRIPLFLREEGPPALPTETRPVISPYLTIALITVLSRLAIYIIGMLAVSPSAELTGIERFVEHWRGADTEHYVRIATYGYQPGTEYENLIVFFPLFPLCMRLVSFILPFGVEFAGIVVSNIALVGAAMLLYRLARECRMTHAEGLIAVCFLLAFPFAMFLQKCYTESLFLFLTIACALAAKKGRWWLCGLMGMLAALTRYMGVVCLAVGVYEFLVQRRARAGKGLCRADLQALWLLLIPLGLCVYLLINLALYGDMFIFLAFERAAPWYQGIDWFWRNLAQHFQMAVSYPYLAYIIYVPQMLLFFIVLGLMAAGGRLRIRMSLLLYGCLLVVASFSSSWLISGGRYMLVVYPMYLVLARLTRRHPYAGGVTLACSLALMMYYTFKFLKGHPIM